MLSRVRYFIHVECTKIIGCVTRLKHLWRRPCPKATVTENLDLVFVQAFEIFMMAIEADFIKRLWLYLIRKNTTAP